MNITIKKYIFGLIIMATLSPLAAFAVTTEYTPLAPLPCIPGANIECPSTPSPTVNVKTYVQYTVNLLIAMAAVAAVFMLVWGGFEYMTSDAVQNKSEGRKKMVGAVSGLVLVLCSFLILRTINPQFVNVPDSLVAPLDLGPTENLSRDWLNVLKNEADSLTISNPQLAKQFTDTKSQIGTLQQQLQDAQDSVYNACSVADSTGNIDAMACQDAANAKDAIQNTLNQKIGDATILTALHAAINVANTFEKIPPTDSVSYANDITMANNAFKKYSDQLAANGGGTYAQQKLLADYHNYTLGVLALQNATNNSSSASIGSIISGAYGALGGGLIGSMIPVVGNIGSSVGFTTMYSNSQQKTFASAVNTAVIQKYANNIQDQSLKNQLIDYSNQIVAAYKKK